MTEAASAPKYSGRTTPCTKPTRIARPTTRNKARHPVPYRRVDDRSPITTAALSSGTVGEFYCCRNLFATGGVQPYTWSVVAGTVPPGLELPRRENSITGTPTAAGTFSFAVRVTDDVGAFSE